MRARFRRSVSGVTLIAALLLVAGAIPSAAAAKEPAACRHFGLLNPSEGTPAELPGSLEAPVLSEYAVFARPQAASDGLPPLNSASSELEYRMTSYYPSEIRQLVGLPNGRRYVVIPGFLRSFEVPPAICLPKSLRKRRAKFVEEETRRATQPAYCIVETGSRRPSGGYSECTLFSETAESREVFSPVNDSETLVEMVPDGVASVRVVYRRGTAVVAPVRENAYLLDVPPRIIREQVEILHAARRVHTPKHPGPAQRRAIGKALARIFRRLEATEPLRVEWLGSGGAVLRTIKPPDPGGSLVIV